MSERGPYLTASRALELERHIARVEARLEARLDQLDAEIATQRAAQIEQLRAMTGALMRTLRDQLGDTTTTTASERGGSE